MTNIIAQTVISVSSGKRQTLRGSINHLPDKRSENLTRRFKSHLFRHQYGIARPIGDIAQARCLADHRGIPREGPPTRPGIGWKVDGGVANTRMVVPGGAAKRSGI